MERCYRDINQLSVEGRRCRSRHAELFRWRNVGCSRLPEQVYVCRFRFCFDAFGRGDFSVRGTEHTTKKAFVLFRCLLSTFCSFVLLCLNRWGTALKSDHRTKIILNFGLRPENQGNFECWMLDFELVISIRCQFSVVCCPLLCCWERALSVPRNGTHDKKSFCFIPLSVVCCQLSNLVLFGFCF